MADLAHIPAETLAILESGFEDDTNSTLREIAVSIYMHLIEDEELVNSLGLSRLADLARSATDRISRDVGGVSFYMPKGFIRFSSARDRDIFAEFNGKNQRELARRYGLSDMRIKQIVASMRSKSNLRAKGNV